jgi:hypothetical protein
LSSRLTVNCGALFVSPCAVVTYGAAPITPHAKAKIPPAARAVRARAWIFVLMVMANPSVLVSKLRRRPAGGNCPSGKLRLGPWSNAARLDLPLRPQPAPPRA